MTMRYLEDPRQKALFDAYQEILSPVAYRRLRNSWQQLFRLAILKLMPAKELGEHFSRDLGRPTKELYSMAGLVFIMEFKDWTHEEAADAYMFDASIQYALNLPPEQQSMTSRTIERYLSLFHGDELAARIMDKVTCELVELLELDVSKQRLDSTHIESDMATFGRTRLMGVTIKNFLTQVKRHTPGVYARLPEDLRKRYEPSRHAMFGDWSRDSESRRLMRQQVAEDMHLIIERFANHRQHKGRSTYKMLCRVFDEQCEVSEEKVALRAHPGGRVVVNPSDPDATYDGHKGDGYQVQLSETCSEGNEAQLITSAIPQTAAEHDSDAVEPILEDLESKQMLPEELTADTAYGSDDNYTKCADQHVELVSPTSGKPGKDDLDEEALTETDFQVDESQHQCTACPAGHTPHRSFYDAYLEQIEILMFTETCAGCPLVSRCPTRVASGWRIMTIKEKRRRLVRRRQYEQTAEFRKRYRIRSGLEATNAMIKRVTGLDRLRVRGRASVFHAILLRVAGWNLLRAASVRALLSKLLQAGEDGESTQIFVVLSCPLIAVKQTVLCVSSPAHAA